MPARCSVPGCSTKAEKGSGPRFYCIPSEINFTGKASPLRVSRRKKWIAALKLQHLQDCQLKNIRICGHHFVTGKPADQYFVHHPDWVPSQKLDVKESKTTVQAKAEFLNKLHLDDTKKTSVHNRRATPNSSDEAASEFTSDELYKYSMPQKRCCVASCLNRMSKTKNSSPSIYYHKFPEDSLSRSRWIYLCQKKGTWDPEHCYICSVHFSADCYSSKGELKVLSVPTVDLISCELSPSKSGKGDIIILEGRPKMCSVPWCKSNLVDGKQMFSFPEDPYLRKTWIDHIYGAPVPVVPSEKAVLCQDHFEDHHWTKSSNGRVLKEDAVPTIFNVVSKNTVTAKESVKRRSDGKEKDSKVKSAVIKREDNNNENLAEAMKNVISTSTPDKVVKIVRVVKRQLIGDHTYSGVDSADDESDDGKKRKLEEEIIGKLSKQNKGGNGRSNSEKRDSNSDVNNAYDNIEELMADLMGEESVKKNKDVLFPSNHRNNASLKINENIHDSLDDYSDYSETDSESDLDKSPSKFDDKTPIGDLKELAEAQKYQLNDLKSENQELIEENERLRNQLDLLRTDPEHASLNLEKSKFMSLVVKLFRKFLNVDQILSLIKAGDPSTAVVWSQETLNRAVVIHEACSDAGYDHLIESGFPLPPRRLFSLLNRNKTQVSLDEKNG